MARRCLLAVIVCTAGLIFSSLAAALEDHAPEDQAEWRAYRSEVGRFAVDLPDVPRHQRWTRNTWGGLVESAEFGVETEKLWLRVETHDLPRTARWLMSPISLLKRAARGLLDDERGELVDARQLEVQDHPAWEVSYRIAASETDNSAGSSAIGRARFVLVADRVYLLSTVSRSGKKPEASIARFLDSFHFWSN